MNPFLFNILVFVSLYLSYRYLLNPNLVTMAEQQSNQDQQNLNAALKDFTPEDLKNLDPENLIVNMNGRQVPFSQINKPHNVVLNPGQHKPKIDVASFPDLEPAAKEREAELAAAREAKKKE
ncbi:hypothetical protein DFJ63DRAFT_314392 [Scheffersomyces coipomensis]|uniref:uncharacterized protein n=1 Tax=Scheffersomyces coipomensis TaxID=1788519 RepID=UPI00315C8EF1